jgi:hypothetical protein
MQDFSDPEMNSSDLVVARVGAPPSKVERGHEGKASTHSGIHIGSSVADVQATLGRTEAEIGGGLRLYKYQNPGCQSYTQFVAKSGRIVEIIYTGQSC